MKKRIERGRKDWKNYGSTTVKVELSPFDVTLTAIGGKDFNRIDILLFLFHGEDYAFVDNDIRPYS